MIVNKIVMGEFPSEPFWDDGKFARLPHIHLPNSSFSNNAMDELLAGFCDETTMLYTKQPFHEVLKEYFHSLGVNFCTDNSVTGNISNIFREYVSGHASFHPINAELFPFAVIDGAHEVMNTISGKNNRLPDLRCVKKVNSKIFSTKLGCAIGANEYGRVLTSIDEIERFLAKGLELPNGVILKEPFGVSGKGSLHITKDVEAKSVLRYLKKQSLAGMALNLVGEPFFVNKACDFSATFLLSECGKIENLCFSEMINTHLSYTGTKHISSKYLHIIENSGYLSLLEKIANCLHQEGYWGPTCIDSMILTSDLPVPIVEINARQSLSRIKYYWDMRFNLALTEFHCIHLAQTHNISYSEFLKRLKHENLLFPQHHESGIIPLSANMLLSKGPNALSGKFYYIIAANCEDEMNDIKFKFRCFIENGLVKGDKHEFR